MPKRALCDASISLVLNADASGLQTEDPPMRYHPFAAGSSNRLLSKKGVALEIGANSTNANKFYDA